MGNVLTPWVLAVNVLNTPQWSTEVIPSSSPNQNDSGIGGTVVDQSQSQEPRDGQATGPRPTSRKQKKVEMRRSTRRLMMKNEC